MALSVLLIVTQAWGQSHELIVNGGPDTLPGQAFPRNKYNVDSGALKFFLDKPSKECPGWTVTRGTVILYDWEAEPRPPRYLSHYFNLENCGGLSQTIDTIYGHHYRLTFRGFWGITGKSVADKGKTALTVSVGPGQQKDFDVPPMVEPYGPDDPQEQTYLFTAAGPKTTIEFYAAKSAFGPSISDIHCIEY